MLGCEDFGGFRVGMTFLVLGHTELENHASRHGLSNQHSKKTDRHQHKLWIALRKTGRHLQVRSFTYNFAFCTTWCLLRTTLDRASWWLSQAYMYRNRAYTSDRNPARTSDTNLARTSDCSPPSGGRTWMILHLC